MTKDSLDGEIAAFMREKGITRCPTACAIPTQARPSEADRTALAAYAEAKQKLKEEKAPAIIQAAREKNEQIEAAMRVILFEDHDGTPGMDLKFDQIGKILLHKYKLGASQRNESGLIGKDVIGKIKRKITQEMKTSENSGVTISTAQHPDHKPPTAQLLRPDSQNVVFPTPKCSVPCCFCLVSQARTLTVSSWQNSSTLLWIIIPDP